MTDVDTMARECARGCYCGSLPMAAQLTTDECQVIESLSDRIAAALRERDAEWQEQQLTLARDYDPNCDEFNFAYQREVMRSAGRTIDAVQELAKSLGRDPEGCLVDACDEAAGIISERDALLSEVHRLRTLPPDVAAAMTRYAAHMESENCVANSPYYDCGGGGFDNLQRLTDVLAIATYFTPLFQKGS